MSPRPHFTHEAMKTAFHLRFPGGEERHLRDVARVCFDAVDAIESKLSRYIDGSDVSQINSMQAGETLFISEECHECLLQAMEIHEQSGGLFDITLGERIEHIKTAREGAAPAPRGILTISPDQPLVHCGEAGRQIDLGGIGKGFAVDRLRQILIEWEVESALVSAGNSTQLAFGPVPWAVKLTGDSGSLRIELHESAMSASGIGIQGIHIVHPDSGLAPAQALRRRRVWLTASSAAAADAWSTAVMLMTDAEIDELAGVWPGGLYVEDTHGVRQWGADPPGGRSDP